LQTVQLLQFLITSNHFN